MHATRLQIIQPAPTQPRQNCAVCANQPNCWKAGISDRHIVTNLLVCRIKRGIQRDKSTRLLLELLKPKLMQMATEIINATGATGLERENVLLDVQSATIEQLMHHYVMGEIGYPLHYLFGMPNGVMRRWVTSQITKTRKHSATYMLSFNDAARNNDDDWAASFLGTVETDEIMSDAHTRELAGEIEDIIDDGITLRLSEYRVLKFCTDNASDAKRPLNGLHIYLGRVMNVVRSRVTKLMADATSKVRDASGFDPDNGDFEWQERE